MWKSTFLLPLLTSLPGEGLCRALAALGMCPRGHTGERQGWAGPWPPPFPPPAGDPLVWVPPCIHCTQTHPPSLPSSFSHLSQLWNSMVQYKSNFGKSTVSVRLFNSDYNGAKGCTCTGFLLHAERLCIWVRCLLPELLLCNLSPCESPDLEKSNSGQESFSLYYYAPCGGMNYLVIPEASRLF